MGQRSADGLNVFRSKTIGGENLDEIGASAGGLVHLGRRKRAGQHHHVLFFSQFDDRHIEARRGQKLRAGGKAAARGFRV